ncbi:MAG TPA: MinD/ParA family protein [Desulfotomaculum sp.]|nr:MAG: ATPase [Peptococcaceae bacterium BRH_c8a]KJS76621.1 MAG: ATPase [Desulfotomaculum sp. BICA1-6]HBX23687.1 MinD/ParA family protein [Desulfotomaculum sp.]
MRIIKHNTFNEPVDRDSEAVPAWGPRVLTITSGKGGVGKTNLSVNLAIALTQLKQRVIIFDADLGLANVDVLLGVTPPFNLYDHLYKGIPIEDVLTPGPGGIRIISGGSGFLELACLTSQQHSRLLEGLNKLNELADFIIIDTGAGISKEVLAFCAAADEVLVVVAPEPTSLADAYGLIKVIDRFKLHRDAYLIVNQSHSEGESLDTVNRLRVLAGKYLSVKVNYLGDIRFDPCVSQAVKKQQPFLLYNCAAAAGVKKIAHAILHKTMATEQQTEQGLPGFISKLGRLFR